MVGDNLYVCDLINDRVQMLLFTPPVRVTETVTEIPPTITATVTETALAVNVTVVSNQTTTVYDNLDSVGRIGTHNCA